MLHMIASRFPDDASVSTCQNYVEWLQLFGDVLACFACRNNFRNNLKLIDFDPIRDTSSRYSFDVMIYRLHSAVNEMLGQPNIGFHDMKLMYEKLYKDVNDTHFATVAITRKENDVRFFDLVV